MCIVVVLMQNSIQLVPDGTLFLHVILIILMIFVLNLTLFRPINRVLKEREQRTQGDSQETQRFLKQIEKSLSKYEQTLREARANGYRLLEKERVEALQGRQILLNVLRDELQGSIEKQKELIKSQVEQSKLTLGDDSGQVATEISRRVLQRPLEG
jgi:F-type H+-transporting ATPase subunit b